jgi:hypothetical protein
MTPIKLKINLENMPHKVYRKVLVPENINMHQLHLVIQIAMGWANSHLFEFSDKKWNGKYRAGISNEIDDYFADSPEESLKDAFEVSLKDIFLKQNDGKPFWYLYDFGDDWRHKISFQKLNKKQLENVEDRLICFEAVGKCPPEDIGGPWGYVDFLEAIQDKNHPEHLEVLEWHGIDSNEEYDTETVNIDLINQQLSGLNKSEDWETDKYDIY